MSAAILLNLGMGGGSVSCFRLYDADTGDVLVPVIPAADRTYDLAGLLGDGDWTLGLSYIDQYGTESEQTVIEAEFSGGAAVSQYIDAGELIAIPVASGEVELQWAMIQTGGQTRPVEYEIADASDLATILATTTVTGAGEYTETLGPFGDGETVALMVRASDGELAGLRGPWVAAPVVIADSQAPDPPTIVD